MSHPRERTNKISSAHSSSSLLSLDDTKLHTSKGGIRFGLACFECTRVGSDGGSTEERDDSFGSAVSNDVSHICGTICDPKLDEQLKDVDEFFLVLDQESIEREADGESIISENSLGFGNHGIKSQRDQPRSNQSRERKQSLLKDDLETDGSLKSGSLRDQPRSIQSREKKQYLLEDDLETEGTPKNGGELDKSATGETQNRWSALRGSEIRSESQRNTMRPSSKEDDIEMKNLETGSGSDKAANRNGNCYSKSQTSDICSGSQRNEARLVQSREAKLVSPENDVEMRNLETGRGSDGSIDAQVQDRRNKSQTPKTHFESQRDITEPIQTHEWRQLMPEDDIEMKNLGTGSGSDRSESADQILDRRSKSLATEIIADTPRLSTLRELNRDRETSDREKKSQSTSPSLSPSPSVHKMGPIENQARAERNQSLLSDASKPLEDPESKILGNEVIQNQPRNQPSIMQINEPSKNGKAVVETTTERSLEKQQLQPSQSIASNDNNISNSAESETESGGNQKKTAPLNQIPSKTSNDVEKKTIRINVRRSNPRKEATEDRSKTTPLSDSNVEIGPEIRLAVNGLEELAKFEKNVCEISELIKSCYTAIDRGAPKSFSIDPSRLKDGGPRKSLLSSRIPDRKSDLGSMTRRRRLSSNVPKFDESIYDYDADVSSQSEGKLPTEKDEAVGIRNLTKNMSDKEQLEKESELKTSASSSSSIENKVMTSDEEEKTISRGNHSSLAPSCVNPRKREMFQKRINELRREIEELKREVCDEQKEWQEELKEMEDTVCNLATLSNIFREFL